MSFLLSKKINEWYIPAIYLLIIIENKFCHSFTPVFEKEMFIMGKLSNPRRRRLVYK